MKYEAIIGLEIHIQLKTKSKMFCSCANIFGDVKPNSAICPICLGYPGTLPVPNKTAIGWTQKAGAALNCTLATKSKFDRKHYFYPDLPKGYQISQYDQPFCGQGWLEIVVNDQPRKIGITRIHLEEDAAKNTHPAGADYTLTDFNRAGTPLMEIVTDPDLRQPEEARIFLQELQRIMRNLNISDADMEKGQLRCDANISLRPKGTKELYPKTEVKNINSFKFVAKALEYEIKRQTDLWQDDDVPKTPSTRGYDSTSGTTKLQRTKEEAADYRYFPEPDIPPFQFSEEELAKIKQSVGELPLAKESRIIDEYKISAEQARLISADSALDEFFEDAMSEIMELDEARDDITAEDVRKITPMATNLILRQMRALILKEDKLNITAENFAELAVLVYQGKVNKGAIDQILVAMQKTGGDPDHIIANLGLEQVSGTEELNKFIDEAIAENPEVVAKIKAGKPEAIQFLMGQVMQKSKGKANPIEVIKILRGRVN
ncbi:MAG: Asp-tRNA(Asn)/Glu-tRNA(Gln) amidotransferase subunit GatB [bacterium]|nr:Asp-tRNA(Asn)/Glu-tRNA(Gln) amidotransferase subunit GatB [bacterium]